MMSGQSAVSLSPIGESSAYPMQPVATPGGMKEVDSATDLKETGAADPTAPEKKKHHHPLNEVHLRIFAWIFHVLSHMGNIMYISGIILEIFQGEIGEYYTPLEVAGLIFYPLQYCFMPLIMIANFSVILRSRNSYTSSLLTYGGYTLTIFLVVLFLYLRYIVPFVSACTGLSYADSCKFVDARLPMIFSFFRQLSFFTDLLIFTLIAFFVLYWPKKYFQGQKIYIFRAFAAIPLAWNIIGYILLGLNSEGLIIPGYIYPLIPLKPPVLLVVFLSLIAFLKRREMLFLSEGHTLEEYDQQFLQPKSVHKFSRFCALSIGVGSVVDFILYMVANISRSEALRRIGVGDSALMFLIVPIVLFLDFSKVVNNPMASTVITIVGWVIIVIMYVEMGFWGTTTVIKAIREEAGEMSLF